MKCALVLLAIACGALTAPTEEDAMTELVNGNHIFTAAVYKELLKIEKGNFIASPLSAETVLALTQEGARGETAAEFKTGLSLPSTNEKIQQAFKNFLPKLTRSDENLKLLSANKIYAGVGVELEPAFRRIASDIYSSEVDNVDFAQSAKAANVINEWVEDHTNKKIQDLIGPQMISGDTKLVLVNALYFSGKWLQPFEPERTSRKKFFKSKEDFVEVDTMVQTEDFNYYENKALNAKFLELPYEGGDISMVIVLPNEIDGLSRVEEHVEQLFESQPFTTETVRVELPKFTMDTKIHFIPILSSLGIERAFDGRADLSGLSSNYKQLYISEVVQKAFINVTESGTEAAAATAVIAGDRTAHVLVGEPVLFKADHPFIYAIRYHGVLLFCGRMVL